METLCKLRIFNSLMWLVASLSATCKRVSSNASYNIMHRFYYVLLIQHLWVWEEAAANLLQRGLEWEQVSVLPDGCFVSWVCLSILKHSKLCVCEKIKLYLTLSSVCGFFYHKERFKVTSVNKVLNKNIGFGVPFVNTRKPLNISKMVSLRIRLWAKVNAKKGTPAHKVSVTDCTPVFWPYTLL